MAITININGLTLVHKDSGGVAKATLPDVCLTPTSSGPVPVNYPNIAFSKDLVKGTTTVFADGGYMCANKGSEFCKSIGDEAGSDGGVISGTHLAEASWITYSPDVFLEGKNACRLTDKMLMNHGNTACLAGVDQKTLDAFFKIVCPFFCALVKEMEAGKKCKPGETWTRKLNKMLKGSEEAATKLAKLGAKFEKSAVVALAKDTAASLGRKAIKKFGKRFGAKLITKFIPYVGQAMLAYDIADAAMLAKDLYDIVRVRPDFLLGDTFGEIKFPGDGPGKGQLDSYDALNGGKKTPLVNKKSCNGCK